MIKLNDNNIFIGHIKQLLKDFNLPSCTIITEDNADENFVSGKHYIKGSQLYLSDGEGSLVRKITYNYGKKYLNLTSNLEINNMIYDRETHRYLGKYLRFLRDQKHVDLMSMYNCFDGETFSKNITITIGNDKEIVFKNDDNYIVYQIPITLNALNLKMFDGREIQLGVYIDANDTYVEGSTKKSCRDFVLEKTYKTMRTTSIFKYDALVTLLQSLKDPASINTILRDFILNNVDKMHLLVKVLKSDLKSIVILEDSKKYLIGINDMRMETTAKIHNVITDKIINDDFSPLEEYVDKINSVTLEEAKEVAKKYFNKKNLCFVRLN